MKEIQELIKRIEAEISKTPTGELRNLLCDANIVLQQQALNIAGVSKHYIELKRDDLQKDKNNLPIDKITLYDFKGSVMSREEIRKAEQIIFVDGEQIKELKTRYATTIEKIENGHFNFSEFNEGQINFIKGLVKLAYNDGYEEGKAEIKDKIWNAIETE